MRSIVRARKNSDEIVLCHTPLQDERRVPQNFSSWDLGRIRDRYRNRPVKDNVILKSFLPKDFVDILVAFFFFFFLQNNSKSVSFQFMEDPRY